MYIDIYIYCALPIVFLSLSLSHSVVSKYMYTLCKQVALYPELIFDYYWPFQFFFYTATFLQPFITIRLTRVHPGPNGAARRGAWLGAPAQGERGETKIRVGTQEY